MPETLPNMAPEPAYIPQDVIIQTAIEQTRQVFNQPNVLAVMHGKVGTSEGIFHCVTVHLSDDQKNNYPDTITVTIPPAQPFTVHVNYIVNVGIPKVFVGCGGPIANANTAGKQGAICCRLYNQAVNQYYLLTCSHVMNAGYSYNDAGQLNIPQPATPTGNWVWGMRTNDIDAALIEVDASVSFQYSDPELAGKAPRALTSDDMLVTVINMAGRDDQGNLKTVSGKITNYSSAFPIVIGYEDGNIPICNLIVLSQIAGSGDSTTYITLSSPGDSGALIYDQDNNPIVLHL